MVGRQPERRPDATARAVAALLAGDGPPDMVTRKRAASLPQCRLRGEVVLAIHVIAAGLVTTLCAPFLRNLLRGPLGGPFAGAALAQSYLDKPVRIVVGFAAGGPTDAIARIVAEKLFARLGKQFYVVNPPGAGATRQRRWWRNRRVMATPCLPSAPALSSTRASSPRWLTIPSGTLRRSR